MARSFNRLTLVGYLGRDPESTMAPSGDHVTEFPIAADEKRKDGITATTWFRVSAFGKTADVAVRYLTKGSYVYIERALALRKYTDREGNRRQALDVRARDLRMLDKASERGETPAWMPNPAGNAPPNPHNVPF